MTHDKATDEITKDAVVDQAIADVRIGLDKGCTCGKTNHDLRGFDIDAYHDENDCRLCTALAALRVLADAVDVARSLDVGRLAVRLDRAEARAVAAEAERDRLAADLDTATRLAMRQRARVEELEAALRK